MSRRSAIADLKLARQDANESALHIGRMITKLEVSYGMPDTSMAVERSHAIQKLDRALTVLRRLHDG